MSELFLRKYSVVVGTKKITGLRCSFTIVKSLSSEPNTAEVKIWNLSEQSRAELEPSRSTGRRDRITLAAGYADTVATIYSGDIRCVDSTREGPDWVTKFTAGDGEVALARKVTLSVRPGTTVTDAVKTVASKLEVNIGNLVDAMQRPMRGGVMTYAKGKAMHGDAGEVLGSMLKSAGFEMSIQDGRLVVLRAGQVLGEAQFVLGPTTGLVGSPQYGTQDAKDRQLGRSPRLKVRSLLQPLLGCGRAVKIDSAAYSTTSYRVEKATHSGDTHGGDWYTDVELKPIGVATPDASGYEPDPDAELTE